MCRDGFTFTFIDPTGWNIRSEPIFEFLKQQRGEFLLNFMAEHVNRHAEFPKVAESFGRFLADPEWENEYNMLPLEWSNELRILSLLRAKIKSSGAALYLTDFPILKPREDRVKMRLLLGTNSAKGLEVFRDVQAKVERTEIETRDELQNSGNAQGRLFNDAQIADMQQQSAGIGCPKYRQAAEERMKEILRLRHKEAFGKIAADILETVPIRLTQLNILCSELKKRNVISFELPTGRRVPQPDTTFSLKSA